MRPHGEQRVAAGPRRAARVAKAEAQRRGVAGDEDAGVERVAEQLAARAERELTRLLARPRRRYATPGRAKNTQASAKR